MPWRRHTEDCAEQGPGPPAPAVPAVPAARLTRAQNLVLYYWMRLTRTLEERLVALYRQTKVVGGLFRSLGQDADAVGSTFALEDYVLPQTRDIVRGSKVAIELLTSGLRPEAGGQR